MEGRHKAAHGASVRPPAFAPTFSAKAAGRTPARASRKANEGFTKIPAGQHADKGLRTFLDAVDAVFATAAIAGATCRPDLAQEGVVVLVDEFGVDIAAQQEAATQDRQHRSR